MYRAWRTGGLFAAVALLAGVAAAQVAPANDPVKIRAKLLTAPYIEGRLSNVNEQDRQFCVQYTHQIKKANPAAKKKLDDLTRRFEDALKKRSTALEDLKKMQADGRALYKEAYQVEELTIDFELKGDSRFSVRTQVPPVGPDGKAKKLTAAEQVKLKGTAAQPGMPASLKDLEAKKWVRAYVDKSKKPTQEGDTLIYPVTLLVLIPEPKEFEPFFIPGE